MIKTAKMQGNVMVSARCQARGQEDRAGSDAWGGGGVGGASCPRES